MTTEQKASAYDELQEQHARIMTETCEGSAKTDELHCTCVPGLERVIAEQRGKFAAMRETLKSECEHCGEHDPWGTCSLMRPGACEIFDALAIPAGKAEEDASSPLGPCHLVLKDREGWKTVKELDVSTISSDEIDRLRKDWMDGLDPERYTVLDVIRFQIEG